MPPRAWLSDWKNWRESEDYTVLSVAWVCRSPISRCWQKRQPNSGPVDSIPGHSIPRARWRFISAPSDITQSANLPPKLFPGTAGVPPAPSRIAFYCRWLRLLFAGGRDARGPRDELGWFHTDIRGLPSFCLLLLAYDNARARHACRKLVAVFCRRVLRVHCHRPTAKGKKKASHECQYETTQAHPWDRGRPARPQTGDATIDSKRQCGLGRAGRPRSQGRAWVVGSPIE